MKRYHLWIHESGRTQKFYIASRAEEDGEWVKHEDAKETIDYLFFANEGLMLDLCRELDLDYALADKDKVIEAIKELKKHRVS